jgi:hypothetical protein
VADLHDVDPVTAANRAIRDHIRACGGRIETAGQQAEYERLLGLYFRAIGRDEPAAA